MLDGFTPLVRGWFSSIYDGPTPVQTACWRALREGSHVLATAPTGSGKTLAAFLSFIDRMASGDLPADRLSLLYVSPLKALNADIRLNLMEPLGGLRRLAAEKGIPFPEITVAVRSGDSTAAERRALLKRPPSILITTPESLAILVNSAGGESILSDLKALVVDEAHALAGTKRGAFLMASVERLTERAGELQRLGLSATVKPLSAAATWLGGFRLVGEAGHGAVLEPRKVEAVDAPMPKAWKLSVELARPPLAGGKGDGFWDGVADFLIRRIRANASTLVFANARRNAEKAAFLVNQRSGEALAWVHHGSLSRELRQAVERRMKEGSLKAIVATSSLELGIDIGAVDEVVLLGSTAEVNQALQRLGRSGHGPGRESRGILLPMGEADILRCALLRQAVLEADIEELRVSANPLDVLAQLILGLCLRKARSADELYDLVRRSANFGRLPRPLFESVLSYLRGRRAMDAEAGDAEANDQPALRESGMRTRGLRKRLWLDPATGLYSSAPGTMPALALAGGVIPDKGCYTLRLAGHGAVIGELDEEFVWERRQGDGFSLGSQRWRIASIGDKDVEVVPLSGAINILPFWKAERQFRSSVLTRRILAFLDAVRGAGKEDLLEACASLGLGREAAQALASFLWRQESSAGLPGATLVPVERYADPLKPTGAQELVIHFPRGLAVNLPLSLVLKEAVAERFGAEPEVFQDNDCVVISLPEGHPGAEALPSLLPEFLSPSLLMARLRRRLEASSWFGALFRENAVRFLAVERSTFGKRVPLWLMRARARELHARMADAPDFPVTVESMRECLEDRFDLHALRELAQGLSSGEILVKPVETRAPSPFARGVVWAETNETLYRSDASARDFSSSFSEAVIREIAAPGAERPPLEAETLAEWKKRRLRLVPGWAPTDAREFGEFLCDMVALSDADAGELAAAGGLSLEGIHAAGEALRFAGGWIHPSREHDLKSGNAAKLLAEWARNRGPFSADEAASLLGRSRAEILEAAAALEGKDALIRTAEEECCDREALESLYRLQRRLQRPEVEAKPAAFLASFLAVMHGITAPALGVDGLRSVLERLLLWPARAADWEGSILPVRVKSWSPALLDQSMAGSELCVAGIPAQRDAEAGADRDPDARRRCCFCFPDQFGFLPGGEGDAAATEAGLPEGRRSWTLWELRDAWGLSIGQSVARLWSLFFSGRAACAGFQGLRAGIADGFQAAKADANEAPRAGFSRARWKAGPPLPGDWFEPLMRGVELDAVDRDEADRAAVSLLIERHGILFRELLARELPRLSWARLFKAMRRMELSGQLLSGHFFEGIPGPQFMSPAGLAAFRNLGEAPVFALSSDDPASVCGLGLAGLPEGLPTRAAGGLAVWRGERLILAARGWGAALDFMAAPEDGACADALKALLKLLSMSGSRPGGRIKVLTVNGADPSGGPWEGLLAAAGFVRGYRGWDWWRD